MRARHPWERGIEPPPSQSSSSIILPALPGAIKGQGFTDPACVGVWVHQHRLCRVVCFVHTTRWRGFLLLSMPRPSRRRHSARVTTRPSLGSGIARVASLRLGTLRTSDVSQGQLKVAGLRLDSFASLSRDLNARYPATSQGRTQWFGGEVPARHPANSGKVRCPALDPRRRCALVRWQAWGTGKYSPTPADDITRPCRPGLLPARIDCHVATRSTLAYR